ncbi:Heat shock 70 kDa protein [Rhynchospora pubera]|uniref:Heat shock 70 kDa protein n=1 Tax=Rhynchospora pubera TaxID=906938 RepID=A0AAV8DYA4_9POAL|nr:Heat shock 70 kDa protein [Rhynchospora pubera]
MTCQSKMSDKLAPAIGIDLGTTYSCVAVWEDDHVEIITNDQGNLTTPSYVSFTEKGRLVGESAFNNAAMDPINTIYGVKRLIGRRFSDPNVKEDIKLWPFIVVAGAKNRPKIVVNYKGEKKNFLAEEISSMVLMKMKQIAETYLGCAVEDAVVTVPAYFNDSQRRATKDAGVIAGLNVKRIMDEPTAAALAYGFHKIKDYSKPQNVFVFDLGGGTFDVSLVNIYGGYFEVKATAGDTHLGGEDFDNRIFNYFVDEFKRKYKKDIRGNSRALRRLRSACERAKRSLSTTSMTTIHVDCLYEGIDFSSTLSRTRFDELNKDLFAKCIEFTDQCLKDAKVNKNDIDIVVLVGGSSRIPKVQQLLEEYFGDEKLHRNINQDEAVAYGAAILAAQLSGQANDMVNKVVLTDVTPLSLGVDITGDVMSIVVARNTSVPTKKVKNFTTIKDDQTSVTFNVYEGERFQASKNHFLGMFNVSGLSPAPRGVPSIDVCFEIDADGILNVSGTVRGSGQTSKLTITNEESWLRKEEIDKMIEEAEKYKAEDEKHKRKVDARRELDDYAYEMSKIMRNQELILPLIPEGEKQRIEDEICEVMNWLDLNKVPPVEASNSKLLGLKEICEPIVAKMKN